MPVQTDAFGGSSSLGGFSGASQIYSTGIPLPNGRVMKNGDNDCIITGLSGYVAGRSATRSVRLDLGSATTAAFNVAAAAQAGSTGMKATNGWLVDGGSATFSILPSGSVYFGRGGSGTTEDGATSFAGRLGGSLRYVEAPSAPLSPAVAPATTPGKARVTWSAPSDNGGTAVTDYAVFYWKTGEAVDAHVVDDIVGGAVEIDIESGPEYNFRVSAKNWVTDSSGTYGVTTATLKLTLPASGKMFNGLAWVASRLQEFTSSLIWQERKVKVFDGVDPSVIEFNEIWNAGWDTRWAPEDATPITDHWQINGGKLENKIQAGSSLQTATHALLYGNETVLECSGFTNAPGGAFAAISLSRFDSYALLVQIQDPGVVTINGQICLIDVSQPFKLSLAEPGKGRIEGVGGIQDVAINGSGGDPTRIVLMYGGSPSPVAGAVKIGALKSTRVGSWKATV